MASITLMKVRKQLREAVGRTSLCGDETYYPATWRFGPGGANANTSSKGDCGLSLAAEHVARSLGLGGFGLSEAATTQREASVEIAEALKRHEAQLAEREAALSDE